MTVLYVLGASSQYGLRSAQLGDHDVPFRRVGRFRAHHVLALGLPEDLGNLVRRLEEVLRGLEVDLLTRLRGRLHRLEHEVVELGELLEMLRLEVVPPEDSDLLLGNL